MEFLIHEFPALYSIQKAHKGPTVGAVIPGHALHVLKTLLYCHAKYDRAQMAFLSILVRAT